MLTEQERYDLRKRIPAWKFDFLVDIAEMDDVLDAIARDEVPEVHRIESGRTDCKWRLIELLVKAEGLDPHDANVEKMMQVIHDQLVSTNLVVYALEYHADSNVNLRYWCGTYYVTLQADLL